MKVLEETPVENLMKDYLYQFQVVFLENQLYSDREAGEIFLALRKRTIQKYQALTGNQLTDDKFHQLIADLPTPLKQGIFELAEDDVRLGRINLIHRGLDNLWHV